MHKKLKAILITTNFPYGGASANLLRYFCFCLRDGGHTIEVFLPTGGYYGKKVDQLSVRNGEIEGVKYKRLGFIHHPRNIFGKILDNLWGLISPFFFLLHKTFTKDLDVIIIYNPTALSMINFLFSKLLLQKRVVIIIPEFYEKPPREASVLARLKWYNFYFAIKYLYKYGDKFIVLSSYLKTYMESRLNRPKEILIMPNLTDPVRFNKPMVTPYKLNYTTIGYVGTPTRKDGILDLIKSFSELIKTHSHLHLLIIGDMTNGNSVIPTLRNYARSLGVKDEYITFNGLTSHQLIPDLLTSCDILALTRPRGVFAEAGFPTKLGEYFATKKPAVITKVGDMASYFKNYEQVVFAEPENISSIVNAFSLLLENPEKAMQIGLRGYQWMDKFLNYRNQTIKISEFILQ